MASGVVNRFDSVMISLCGLSLRALDVEEALAAGAAGLVDHHHRLLHQIVLGDDALDGARHLVGAAAGAGRHDDLDGRVGSHAWAGADNSANAPPRQAAAKPKALLGLSIFTPPLFSPHGRSHRRLARFHHPLAEHPTQFKPNHKIVHVLTDSTGNGPSLRAWDILPQCSSRRGAVVDQPLRMTTPVCLARDALEPLGSFCRTASICSMDCVPQP